MEKNTKEQTKQYEHELLLWHLHKKGVNYGRKCRTVALDIVAGKNTVNSVVKGAMNDVQDLINKSSGISPKIGMLLVMTAVGCSIQQ